MDLTTDATVFWRWGPIVLNATLVYTWIAMSLLVAGSWLITRKLRTGRRISPWQSILETLVDVVRGQIRDIAQRNPDPYLPFIGTLFLFISAANLLGIVPGLKSPAGSLSTTAALAICVFFAVPIYGITERGIVGYLEHYVQPSVVMFPFHILSEITRTFALAVRLFGNIMSGNLVVSIIVSIIPLFLPVVLQGLELLIGQIQAYIFAVLSMVYIASAAKNESR